MTMGTVEESIRTYIAERFLSSDNGYPFPDDASFLQEGIIDWSGMTDLVKFVSQTFGITVEDEEFVVDNLDSVSRLAGYIRLKAPLEACS